MLIAPLARANPGACPGSESAAAVYDPGTGEPPELASPSWTLTGTDGSLVEVVPADGVPVLRITDDDMPPGGGECAPGAGEDETTAWALPTPELGAASVYGIEAQVRVPFECTDAVTGEGSGKALFGLVDGDVIVVAVVGGPGHPGVAFLDVLADAPLGEPILFEPGFTTALHAYTLRCERGLRCDIFVDGGAAPVLTASYAAMTPLSALPPDFPLAPYAQGVFAFGSQTALSEWARVEVALCEGDAIEIANLSIENTGTEVTTLFPTQAARKVNHPLDKALDNLADAADGVAEGDFCKAAKETDKAGKEVGKAGDKAQALPVCPGGPQCVDASAKQTVLALIAVDAALVENAQIATCTLEPTCGKCPPPPAIAFVERRDLDARDGKVDGLCVETDEPAGALRVACESSPAPLLVGVATQPLPQGGFRSCAAGFSLPSPCGRTGVGSLRVGALGLTGLASQPAHLLRSVAVDFGYPADRLLDSLCVESLEPLTQARFFGQPLDLEHALEFPADKGPTTCFEDVPLPGNAGFGGIPCPPDDCPLPPEVMCPPGASEFDCRFVVEVGEPGSFDVTVDSASACPRRIEVEATAVYYRSFSVSGETTFSTNVAGSLQAPGATPDPVIRVLSGGAEIASDDDGAGAPDASVTITADGFVEVLIHAYDATAGGLTDLLQDGVPLAEADDVPVGGVQIPSSCTVETGDHVETVHRPGALKDSVLFLLDNEPTSILELVGPWRIEARDRNGGIGRQAAITQAGSDVGVRFLVGADDVGLGLNPPAFDEPLDLSPGGPAIVLVNDAFTDSDGDGLGHFLEVDLGTCDGAFGGPPGWDCADDTRQSKDTDGDGIDDSWEVRGCSFDCCDPASGFCALDIGGFAIGNPQYLPQWGADPLHKDLFAENDAFDDTDTSLVIEAERLTDPEVAILASDQVFLGAGTADWLDNPDGGDGIRLHVDNGGACADPTMCGDWGGSNVVAAATRPPDCDTAEAEMVYERRSIFYYWFARPAVGSSRGTWVGYPPPREPTTAEPRVVGDLWVLIHETGHALGLDHGGGDRVNCKPNYLSVMNYAVRNRESCATPAGPGFCGFSEGTFEDIVTLNLGGVCEEDGLSTPDAALLDHLSAEPYFYDLDLSDGSVDWNRDGTHEECTSSEVAAPITFFDLRGDCGATRLHSAGEDEFHQTIGTHAPGAASRPVLARAGDAVFVFWSAPQDDGTGTQLVYRYLPDEHFVDGNCSYSDPALGSKRCHVWQPDPAADEPPLPVDGATDVDSIAAHDVAGGFVVLVYRQAGELEWRLVFPGDPPSITGSATIPGSSGVPAMQPDLTPVGGTNLVLVFLGSAFFGASPLYESYFSGAGLGWTDAEPIDGGSVVWALGETGVALTTDADTGTVLLAYPQIVDDTTLPAGAILFRRLEGTTWEPVAIDGAVHVTDAAPTLAIGPERAVHLNTPDDGTDDDVMETGRTYLHLGYHRVTGCTEDTLDDCSGYDVADLTDIGAATIGEWRFDRDFDVQVRNDHGVDFLLDPAEDRNLRAVLVLRDARSLGSDADAVVFRPFADGLAPVDLRDWNDWELIGQRLCERKRGSDYCGTGDDPAPSLCVGAGAGGAEESF